MIRLLRPSSATRMTTELVDGNARVVQPAPPPAQSAVHGRTPERPAKVAVGSSFSRSDSIGRVTRTSSQSGIPKREPRGSSSHGVSTLTSASRSAQPLPSAPQRQNNSDGVEDAVGPAGAALRRLSSTRGKSSAASGDVVSKDGQVPQVSSKGTDHSKASVSMRRSTVFDEEGEMEDPGIDEDEDGEGGDLDEGEDEEEDADGNEADECEISLGAEKGAASFTSPSPSNPESAAARRITVDSSGNAPKIVYRSEPVPNQIILCVSPFTYRMPSILFQPCDKPITGHVDHNNPTAYAFPSGLGGGLVPVTGQQKRIGRKKKYGKISFCLPDGAVRFSSVVSIFTQSGFEETSIEGNWSVMWTKRVEPELYAELQWFQRVNHFPGTWSIGRKDNLHKKLTSRLRRYGKEHYGFFPKGFLLPADRLLLKDEMEQLKAGNLHGASGSETQMYILKPVASACGRGVKLLTTLPSKKKKGLVQQYIANPLLINGFKFDLRIYVVVTSYDPLRIYVYQEGLVRFASSPYPTVLATQESRDHCSGVSAAELQLKKRTAHLTNFSVNKLNKAEFVTPTDAEAGDAAAEKASKWTHNSVRQYFQKHNLDWDGAWARIEDLIIKTILCAEPDVVAALRRFFPPTTSYVRNCFELYGFDVLLREDLTPVLMEVNIMPSLSTKCSLLDQRVKANMIADMLTMVGGYSPSRKHNARKSDDPSIAHPFFAGLKPDQLEMVLSTEEEFERRMHFTRLFPTKDSWDKYKEFFPEPRPRNVLLQNWERVKEAEGVTSWSEYVKRKKGAGATQKTQRGAEGKQPSSSLGRRLSNNTQDGVEDGVEEEEDEEEQQEEEE
jgi:hypothetical protein